MRPGSRYFFVPGLLDGAVGLAPGLAPGFCVLGIWMPPCTRSFPIRKVCGRIDAPLDCVPGVGRLRRRQQSPFRR
jgi:hypothetical protein